MTVALKEKDRAEQILRGIILSSIAYLFLIGIVVPWTFILVGPGPVGSLLGGGSERATFDIFLHYASPFLLAFLGGNIYSYFRTKDESPVFAQSLLMTAFIEFASSLLLSATLVYWAYVP